MELYKNINLDRNMYNISGKEFCQTLEERDPSKKYVGTELENLDPFERQLKRFNIKVSGKNSDNVEKFFKSGDSAFLFPEFVNRSVRMGVEETSPLDEIIATTTTIDTLDYRSITSDFGDSDKNPAKVAMGAKIPETTIKAKSNLVKLYKRGRLLVAPYEVIRYQRLDLFTVTLKQIGAAIKKSQMEDAVNVLLNGDGNNNPAAIVNAETAGKIGYNDLLNLWAMFDKCEMNTLLVSSNTILKLAVLEEFKNPLTGINFAGTGKINTPLGANLIKSNQVPDGVIIALDRTSAIEKVDNGAIEVEHDKLIDRQLERAAITATSGFTKIFDDSVKVLKF